MPASLLIDRPLRRPAAALALAVSLAMLLLGATAPQAPARAHGAGCRHSSRSHRQGHRGSCASSRHRSKKARSGRPARHAGRPARHAGRPAKHAVHPAGGRGGARARVKPGAVSNVTVTATLLARHVAARCEDGSSPVRVEDEVFECEDGSEPRCEAGSAFVLSSDGSSLLCSPDSLGSGEAGCTDGSSAPCGQGSAPPPCSGAAPSCEDTSGEAGCESGAGTAGQGDPTLVCDAPGGEAGDSPASRQPSS